ncbi:MAG TPA: tRNA (guanosine(37)-N1)-methyltransferase TrmD [bacterium]|nr:tRNA (guanosine(37)-N1)-methyltransferase TrmD [bacterium]
MRFDILTIFPAMFESPLSETIIKRAREKGLVEFHMHDIRDFAKDRHRSVDDTPYGGGAGMVMLAAPLVEAVESVPKSEGCVRILMTPQGEPFTQKIARDLTRFDQVVLVCGRYEGIDERARKLIADRELSIGDYVLSGGEIPAMVVIDSITRLLPGVLGNDESIEHESFESCLLEYPHYTRPETFRSERVPDVLLSGHHAEITKWRRREALRRTLERRPELLYKADLTGEERAWVKERQRDEGMQGEKSQQGEKGCEKLRG